MSGTFTGKTLGAGYLPITTAAATYTVPALTVGNIAQFSVYNSNSATQTVMIYKRISGVSYPWHTITLNQNESAEVLEEGDRLTLSAGDGIYGVTTTASAVAWVATGVEET